MSQRYCYSTSTMRTQKILNVFKIQKKQLHVNVIIDTITECLSSASKSTKHKQGFFLQICEVSKLAIMYKRNQPNLATDQRGKQKICYILVNCCNLLSNSGIIPSRYDGFGGFFSTKFPCMDSFAKPFFHCYESVLFFKGILPWDQLAMF